MSSLLVKQLETVKKKDTKLHKRIQKQLNLFKLNTTHPSLRIHKLSGPLKQMWTLSVTTSLRIAYIQKGEDIFLLKIGTHDEVYRK